MGTKSPGKVVITPRPPVGSGDQNGDDGSGIVMRSNKPQLEDLVRVAPDIDHDEALAPGTKLPKVTIKKADAIKKEALDPKKKTVCKKKAK